MPRYIFCNTLAALLIGAAAASSATAQDITVKGLGQHVVDRTNLGAEVIEYTASVVINVRDLDLASPAGWSALEDRVTAASLDACDVIKQNMTVDLLPERGDCARAAYRETVARVRELAKTSSN